MVAGLLECTAVMAWVTRPGVGQHQYPTLLLMQSAAFVAFRPSFGTTATLPAVRPLVHVQRCAMSGDIHRQKGAHSYSVIATNSPSPRNCPATFAEDRTLPSAKSSRHLCRMATPRLPGDFGRTSAIFP